jgi:hypothetical protein
MAKISIASFNRIMRNPIVFLTQSLFCVSLLLSSCVKCDETRVEGGYLVISFVDSASGKYIYTPSNSILSQDSLRIVDDNGKMINFDLVESVPGEEKHITVGVYFLVNENTLVQNSFYKEQCKSINIYLSIQKQVRYTVCFTSKTVKCGSAFDRLTVSRNGQEIPIVKDLESVYFTERL